MKRGKKKHKPKQKQYLLLRAAMRLVIGREPRANSPNINICMFGTIIHNTELNALHSMKNKKLYDLVISTKFLFNWYFVSR